MDDEEELEGSSKVYCILRDPKGKVYLAKCDDVTEGGLILKVDKALVKQGIFPDEYLDTRFVEDEMGFKIFILYDDMESLDIH